MAAFHAVEQSLPGESVTRVTTFFGWSNTLERFLDLRLRPNRTFALRVWRGRNDRTPGAVEATRTGAWRWDASRQRVVLEGAGEGMIDFTARSIALDLTAPRAVTAEVRFLTFIPEYVPLRDGISYLAIALAGETLLANLSRVPVEREIVLPARIAFTLGLPVRLTAGALREHLFEGYRFRPSIPALLIPNDIVHLLVAVGD